MRRGLALARDYAKRRVQFGSPLADKPLHADTIAGLQAEYEGAFQLAFRAVELLGRAENGEADEHETRLLRLLTPVAKLTTGKQSVAAASEVLECFGGAGYVEDTGVPRLLRDAQVLPIWEGTTNVLSLDLLRAIGKELDTEALETEFDRIASAIDDQGLATAARDAHETAVRACRWMKETAVRDPLELETGARRFALTIGRSMELALLCKHADWCGRERGDNRSAYAAHRFRAHGIDQIRPELARAQAEALAR
jgi:hypothetical protein